MKADAVIWHDVECHGYEADLGLWHELGTAAAGPVLDVGAGTGRVALPLAASGFEVVALDVDASLLDELRRRAEARGVRVATIAADASSVTSFPHGGDQVTLDGFGLVIVPMQTIQLLGDRAGFLANARRALRAGGLLAMAIAEDLETFDGDLAVLPEPETADVDGWHYSSQPTAIRANGAHTRIDRIRTRTSPDGTLELSAETIALATLTAEQLESEALDAGFHALPRRIIPATREHVGSTVVIVGA